MHRSYGPLPSHPLPSEATFHQPILARPPSVKLDDPAIAVMTDFRRIRAITVPESVPMEFAAQRMRANRVHLLLVTDDRNVILGLVTSTDIEGEKPLVLIQKHRIRRNEITVRDVMTPADRLEVIEMSDVLRACVGHIVATFHAVGRQHAMVIDRDDNGDRRVRGLFAVSQLTRQLGTIVEPAAIARSFAEVESALAD